MMNVSVEHSSAILDHNEVVESDAEDHIPLLDNERMKDDASSKKRLATRKKIVDLRNEYEDIVRINESLPNCSRISHKDLIVDKSMHKSRERDELERIYTDILENEVTIVTNLKDTQQVKTFPVLKLPSSFQHLRSHVKVSCGTDLATKEGTKSQSNMISHSETTKCCDKREKAKTNQSKNRPRGMSTFDDRKAKRTARKEQIENMIKEKPELTNDPNDILFQETDQKNLGDWKLKASENYEVPEGIYLNLQEKIKEMSTLALAIREMKINYNQDLLKLKNQRSNVKQVCLSKAKRLQNICEALGESSSFQTRWPLHFPENITLSKEKTEFCVKDTLETMDESLWNIREAVPRLYPQLSSGPHQSNSQTDELSPIEKDEKEVLQKLLQHEKNVLICRIEDDIMDFEKCFHQLQKKYYQESINIKAGESKLLVMLQEIRTLQDAEEKSRNICTELNTLKKDRAKVISSMQSHKTCLNDKELELSNLMKRNVNLQIEVDELAPKSSPHFKLCSNIYKEGMKQNEHEENYKIICDDDENFEKCPKQLYDSIVQLRDESLENERQLSSCRQELDGIKTTYNDLSLQDKRLENQLQQCQKEFQDFLREKQEALNDISISIPFSSKQIYLWNQDEAMIDAPMSESIVFSNNSLQTLRKRIRDYIDDIKQQRETLKCLQKERDNFIEEIKSEERVISEQFEKCKDLQMLKFGQLVDIDELDRVTCTGTEFFNAEGKYQKELQALEGVHRKEISKLQKENISLKNSLQRATTENTAVLNQIADLGEKHMKLEKMLTKQVKTEKLVKKSGTEECDQLIQTTNKQIQQMNKLKIQIMQLKRKEDHGHEFTP